MTSLVCRTVLALIVGTAAPMLSPIWAKNPFVAPSSDIVLARNPFDGVADSCRVWARNPFILPLGAGVWAKNPFGHNSGSK